MSRTAAQIMRDYERHKRTRHVTAPPPSRMARESIVGDIDHDDAGSLSAFAAMDEDNFIPDPIGRFSYEPKHILETPRPSRFIRIPPAQRKEPESRGSGDEVPGHQRSFKVIGKRLNRLMVNERSVAIDHAKHGF